MMDHNKIINQVAKSVLAPHGFFQKGRSRTWLYDCGYFFVQIEFQPSGWERGSYCNVGIGFLFEYTDGLNETIAFNYGYEKRIGRFIAYENDDDAFRLKMEKMASAALEYALELIKFESLEYADAKLTKQIRQRRNVERIVYEAAMIKILRGELKKGLALLKEWKDGRSFRPEWFVEWVKEVYPKFTTGNLTKEDAINIVIQTINRRRAYFAQKPSYKKMNSQNFELTSYSRGRKNKIIERLQLWLAALKVWFSNKDIVDYFRFWRTRSR